MLFSKHPQSRLWVSFHRQKFSDKAFAVLQEQPLLCVAVKKNRGSRLRLLTVENFANEVYAIVTCKTKTKLLSKSDFRLPGSARKTVGPLKNINYILILLPSWFSKLKNGNRRLIFVFLGAGKRMAL